jgi:hypothetical protein
MVLYRNNNVTLGACGAYVNSSTVDEEAPMKSIKVPTCEN